MPQQGFTQIQVNGPTDDKARVVAGVRREVWPLVEAGAIKPIVHDVLPLAAAQAAHELVESSEHVGKVLLARP